MRGIALFFYFVTLICIRNVRALQVDYMDGSKTRIDLRNPSVGYKSSGILKSHRGGKTYRTGMNKTLYVSAPSGYSLVVSIRIIDLRPNRQDVLKIFTTNGNPLSFTNSNTFSNRKSYPKEDLTYFAPSGLVGIQFTTNPGGLFPLGYDGFQLVYTTVGNGYLCSSEDFRCSNGRCIAHELECDGHNHCGDQSSLNACTGPGRKIGISLGVVFLVIAAACGIYIAVRRARGRATETHTIITDHPPPQTNLPSYPPAYPQPGTDYPPPPPPYSQGVVNPTYH